MARRALLAVVASALVVSGCNAGIVSVPTLPAGTILVADEDAFGGSGGVIRVNPTTGAQTVVSSGGNFVEPTAIAIAVNGDILIADRNAFGGGGGVIRVNSTTGAQTVVSSGGNFLNPPGIAVVAYWGFLWVARTGDGRGREGGIRGEPASGE